MQQDLSQAQERGGLTRALAERSRATRLASVPTEIAAVARQCILDWIGVAIAGSGEPLVTALLGQQCEQGGHPQAAIVAHVERLPTVAAALLNGAMSHALDYDDVNLAMHGHPTVAVLPGVLALAEQRRSSGAALMEAFVAGYEAACAIGSCLGASHYARGFHATATIGSFGSAAACAHLLQLGERETVYAFGIAGTQAAGLKSMFGTMCKPLHAGRAASNGLGAALLAARGFDSRRDVLEADQGFASTQSDGIDLAALDRPPEGGYHLRSNLFKYHASCYGTHAAIECARALASERGFDRSRVKQVRLQVPEGSDKMCNIAQPRTGLEAKFSLRQTTAFALSGIDTARLETFAEASVGDASVVALRDQVAVELVQAPSTTWTRMEVELVDGQRLSTEHDSGVPAASIEQQGQRIEAKFLALATPVLGAARAGEIVATVRRLEQLPSVAELTRLLGR